MKSIRSALLLSVCVASTALIGVSYGEAGKSTGLEGVQEGTSKVQDVVTGAAKGAVDPLRDKTAKEVDAKTANDIRQRLASVINNSVSHNGFDDLLGSLAKNNRDRIAENRFKDYDKLNGAIDKFRNEFRSVYGQDFDLKSALLDNVKIYEGQDKDHASARFGMLLRADLGRNFKEDLKASDVKGDLPPYGLTGDEKRAARDVHAGNMGLHTLHLVNEGVIGNGWRIELNNPTAEGLSASLIKHLDQLSSMKASWPKDINDAYRLVSGHMLQALLDTSGGKVVTEK